MSEEHERAKRPELARTQPIRSWSGLVGAPGPAHDGSRSGPGSAAGGAGAPAGVDDVIVRSVEVGYRVIDEYVKRGQAAAERMQHGAYGASDMARDAQGIAGQLVRSAADVAGAWLELCTLASRNPPAPFTAPENGAASSTPAPTPDASPGIPKVASTAAGYSPPGAPDEACTTSAGVPDPSAAADPLPVRLEVHTARPVAATLEVRPLPAGHALVVHALRDPGGARLEAVEVALDGGVVVLRVRIDADRPAGCYRGLVIDDTINVPLGALTVAVPAA